MTTSDDHVPGQLDLVLDLVPDDLDTQEDRVRAELDRLTALRMEHTVRAIDAVAGASIAWRRAVSKLDAAVADARSAGATWQQVADAVGMTRQSAWRRWSTPDDEEER